MSNSVKYHQYLGYVLLPVIALCFFYNIYAVPLFDLDEGAFSEATREMFVRGDFLSTYLNGVPRHDKPILIYWLQSLSVALFGINEFAFRLPSALVSSAWVCMVFWFVSSITTVRHGLMAALMMAASLEISVIAKAATADALLNFLITGAMMMIYLYHLRRKHIYIYLCFLFMALGFLTKGPVAVVIPFIVSGIFFAIEGNLKLWLKTILHPGGIALFLLVAAPWYVAQYFRDGEGFIKGFFLEHNLGRFQAPMERHSGSIFYYIPIILIGVLPYTTILIKTSTHLKEILGEPLQRFLMIWFLVVLFIFSLSATKLPHYIVYGYPAIFILMALYADRCASRVLLFIPPLLFFLFMLLLPELIGALLPKLDDPFMHSALLNYSDYFGALYRWFFTGTLLLCLYFMVERRASSMTKILVCGVLTVLAITQFLLPITGAILQAPIKEAARLAKIHDYQVVMWRMNTPSFNVYSERLTERREPVNGDVVLTKSIYLADFPAFELLYQKNGVSLIRIGGSP